MRGLKRVIVQESDMADNAEAVSEDGKFVRIAEMPVNVHLFCIRAGSGLGGHETVGHFVRVNVRLVFIVSLEASDEGIEGFGVVFRNKKFNAGSIKSKDLCKGRVNGLADGLGEVNHALEHHFNIRKESLFKASKKRGIGNFGKATEIP